MRQTGGEAVHTVDPRRRDEHIRLLATAGIDVAAAYKSDQFELRDWTDAHLRDGHFDQQKTLALFEKVLRDAKEKVTKFRGDVVVDVMRTHPLVIIGGIIQENPFFVPPDEFLREL
ncbi:MAG TPA: MEDS domain-containing protein [Methylococcaceae bacterium]|nr:MEDS domain-containing protein [Methylococcaceae bacterium]